MLQAIPEIIQEKLNNNEVHESFWVCYSNSCV